ncbi:benzoate/H(+) symporter BenE family transporter [Aeromicrobium duanguangcaii]|uniref:benzoate/H(+) symporter BenE family transporter n=1 Tax=Aeromicrobium duanguangcaii TaxID=2968086 RepID=UPI002016CC59|nr:benzoate/H(+) symporter BenE family transporter [Aeromicrobium duanguangcaii]
MSPSPAAHDRLQPVTAGVVTALVGFTSSFAVVLAGLRAVGATESQAASGLFALTVGFGLLIIALALTHRVPVTLAWSTPGAALLVSTGGVDGGWSAAVGAFVLTGVLIALIGAIPFLGALVARIPAEIAQAMLAGILLPLCLAPFLSLADSPGHVAPVIVTWLVVSRVRPRWAVPAALLVAVAAIAVSVQRSGRAFDTSALAPTLEWTTPTWTWSAIVGIAIPLTIVTMASQNLPGAAVLRSFGFAVPWRSCVVATGLGTAIVAPFGGHAMNLAALSAALAAGDEAGPRERRWLAAVSAGVGYLVIAGAAGIVVALAAAAPAGIIEAVAGLALIGALVASLQGALAAPRHRTSAGVTFLFAASGVTLLSVGSAFWSLLLGLIVRAVLERRDPDHR